MAFGFAALGSQLLGGADPLSGFTDSGSAVSGATLGPVTIGGINPAPQSANLLPVAIGVALAIAAGLAVSKL